MRRWILSLGVLCVVGATPAFAQGRVTGSVTSETGQPIPRAVVSIAGTVLNTYTDSLGVYLFLRVPVGTQQITARQVGYAAVTHAVTVVNGQTASENFQLHAAPIQLEGLVAIAYGTQERRDITGSVSTVTADVIAETPTANPMQAIQGRVPGVDVVQGGSYRPGVPMNVRIRGTRSITASNEPLYVVDGVPLVGGIEDFNPSNIESIDILKDASATAAYGSRGANGVVLITSKHSGGGTRITMDGSYGTSNELRLADMMDGQQRVHLVQDAYRYDGRSTAYTAAFTPDELPAVYCADSAAYAAAHPGCSPGTDWQRTILRDGNQSRLQFGLSSTLGTSRVNLAGSYYGQDGITLGQGFNQYSGTVSFDNTFGRLRVGATASGARSIAQIGADAGLWGEALANNPLGMPYDSAGTPYASLCSVCTMKVKPTPDPLRVNPLRQEEGYIRQQNRTRLFGSAFGEFQIGRGLSARVNFGPDFSSRMDGQFQGANTVFNQAPLGNAQAQRLDEEDFAYTLDMMLLWNRTINSTHRIDATLLYGIQADNYTSTTAASQNLPYDQQLWYNLNTGENPQPPQSTLAEWALRSYMARVNYVYANKYMVTVTGRFDGSSRLAEENRWSFFPSIGLGWQLGDEAFMRNMNFISTLKLRASLGTVGNTSINPYQTFGSLNRTRYNYGAGSGAGYQPGAIANPDLQWEKSSTLNFGVDFGVLRDRISGTLDIYQIETNDLLMPRQLPASTGYTQTLQNIGSTANRGWELGVSTVMIPGVGNKLRWTLDLGFTHNRNYITKLSAGAVDDPGNTWFIGQPINVATDGLRRVWYDYEFNGIWQLADSAIARRYGQQVGQIRVVDQNGDSAITGADRIIQGNTYPKMIASIYNRLTIGHFDLSFLFQGRLGYTMNDQFSVGSNNLFDRFNNLDVQYYTLEKCDGGPDQTVRDGPAGTTAAAQAAIPGCNENPVPSAARQAPIYISTTGYRSGSHWRMRNITLGYTLPASMTRRYMFNSVRFYFQAQDPFVFTDYHGYDPENGSAATPPSYRTVIFGATLGF